MLPTKGRISQREERSDYLTTNPSGFERIASISTDAVLLPFLALALHEDTPDGVFVLLFDMSGQEQAAGIADGALAKLTLGPVSAGGIGATVLLSESETEAHTVIADNCPGGMRTVRGLPFDKGLALVLSSTPGRLTALANNPSGARIWARRQY